MFFGKVENVEAEKRTKEKASERMNRMRKRVEADEDDEQLGREQKESERLDQTTIRNGMEENEEGEREQTKARGRKRGRRRR
jgi:hypothetical protein